MATQSLIEAAKLINDEIVAGIVADIIDVNPMYASLPFTSYQGQAIVINRENALGDSEMLGVDGTIVAKAAATFSQKTRSATKLIGDVEMDGLVQAQSASAGVNQIAVEISSKAKSIGRLFQQGMATGDNTGDNMHSFHTETPGTQFTGVSAGQALSFELMDEGMDLVLSKDGEVDFCMMPRKIMRAYKVLLRALGGTAADWVVTLPDGRTTIGYEGVPIFSNTFLSTTETANGAALAAGALSSVWFGNFDDGSQKIGVSGIYPEGLPAGIQIKDLGAQETKDTDIIRLKMYANFCSFSEKAVGRLVSINN